MATAVIETAIVVSLPPEVLGPSSEYEKKRLALSQQYNQITHEASKVKVVDSPESLEQANNLGRILQAGSKDVELFFRPIKQQIDSFKAPVLAAENTLKNLIDGEKRRLGSLITTYNQERERIRQEEERKQREEAERQAREQQLQMAIDLEASGDKEAAEELLNEEVAPVAVVVQQEAPLRQVGQVGKTIYSCEVTNMTLLLKAVSEGRAPMQCFTLDQGWLNKKAALEKDGFNVPGCKLKKTASTHFRA